MDCTNNGKKLKWIINERGARGGFYTGQPIRIAIFGSSTSIDSLLDQHQSWSEQLKKELGSNNVQVDNYARDAAGRKEAKIILDYFLKIGRRYDIILTMVQTKGEGDSEKYAFRYWGNWSLKPGLLKFPNLLRNRAKEQVKTEPRLNSVDRFIHDELFPSPTLSPKVVRTEARRLRLSGQAKLIDKEIIIGSEENAEIRNRTRSVFEAASRVADKVYLLTHPVAYAPDEHPAVAKRWYALKAVDGRTGYYHSNKSIAFAIRGRQEIMKEVAVDMDISIIDLDSFIMPKLCQRYDMFEDTWHFAPAGAEIAARFIAETLRANNPELRK